MSCLFFLMIYEAFQQVEMRHCWLSLFSMTVLVFCSTGLTSHVWRSVCGIGKK